MAVAPESPGPREGLVHCPGCASPVDGARPSCPFCSHLLAGAQPIDHHATREIHATPVDWPPRMTSGVVVAGAYRIDRFIAQGGMGEVYEGTDTSLERRVAIKFLSEAYRGDRMLVQRFLREARSVASLDHPNIVSVFAVGDHDGRPLMVMKYIDGSTVTQLVQSRGRLRPEEALDLGAQVCDGLEHIHQRGFVHRDIKPQNLMVDQSGRVIILDFGILRPAASVATATGMVFGTPAYMPPEQAKDAKLVDGRSDLYALGVSLFEMLTGVLPFKAASGLELLVKHQMEAPPPPSQVVPSLSPALDAVVARALAKDPAARYGTAAEMAEALRSVQAGLSRGDSTSPKESVAALVVEARGRTGARAGKVRDETTAIAGESLARSDVHRSRSPLLRRFGPLAAGLALVIGALAWWGLSTFRGPDERGERTGPSAASRPAAPSAPTTSTTSTTTTTTAVPPSAGTSGPTKGVTPSGEGSPFPTAPSPVKVAAPAPREDPSEADERDDRRRAKVAAAEPGENETPGEAPKPAVVEPKTAPAPTQPVPTPAPKGPGTLRVVTLHEGKGLWARISIDGQESGNQTHVFSTQLPAGPHVVRAEREGFAPASQKVDVSPGATARVRLVLRKE